MAAQSQTSKVTGHVDAGVGIFWFIGWLFTIAFAKLIWWQALLAASCSGRTSSA